MERRQEADLKFQLITKELADGKATGMMMVTDNWVGWCWMPIRFCVMLLPRCGVLCKLMFQQICFMHFFMLCGIKHTPLRHILLVTSSFLSNRQKGEAACSLSRQLFGELFIFPILNTEKWKICYLQLHFNPCREFKAAHFFPGCCPTRIQQVEESWYHFSYLGHLSAPQHCPCYIK